MYRLGAERFWEAEKIKNENFQSQVCVCAASTNLTGAEIQRRNGVKDENNSDGE